jgi:peptidyl-prolyl cis-trans isomerase C
MAKLVVLGVLITVVAMMAGCGGEESEQADASKVGSGRDAIDSAEGGKMAVKVDERTITEAEVAAEEGRLAMAMGGRMDPQQLESMKPMIREQALNNLINRELLNDAVRKEGIEVSSGEVDARLAELETASGGPEGFENRLSVMGVTKEEIRQEIELGIAVEKMMEGKAGAPAEPTDADLRAFYDDNPEQFQRPEQVKASHILFMVEADAGDEGKAAKRKEAEGVLAQLKGGADFAALAAEHSDCPSSSKGGDLGYFRRGQMVPPFEEVAFALEPGEMSGIVETRFGYHIIKVAERAEPQTVPFEEAKPNIAQFLGGQNRQQVMNSVIEDLRAEAKIEYPE